MSRRIWVVILFAAAIYTVGNGRVQLWDRDEPRYAQTSRQMLQSGDWVVPTYLDEPRLKKPPLIYWAQAGAMALLADPADAPHRSAALDAFAARFPSVIATLLTLMLLGSTLARIADEPRAFWAVLVMATSGLVIMAAKMSLTDAVLLLFVTTSQLMIYALWLGQRDWWTVTVFAAATGLALLTKGPVVLGVNLMTLLVLAVFRWLDKRNPQSAIRNPQFEIRKGHPVAKTIFALLVVAAIVTPWAVGIVYRFEGEKLWDVVYKEVILRVSTPLEQHKGPPGYYLLFFFATFFPWCVLLPTVAKWAWRLRADPLVRFSLAAVVGPWLMFEVIQTKLPHYVLPCFPFLAILTAEVLTRAIRGHRAIRVDHARRIETDLAKPRPRIAFDAPDAVDLELGRELTSRAFKTAVAIWAGALIVLGLALWIPALSGVNFGMFKVPDFGFDRIPYGPMIVVSLAAIVTAVFVARKFHRDDIPAGATALGGTMFVVFFFLFTFYLPRARFLHLSAEVGGFLRAQGATRLGDVVMIDYKEDTLPFYQGGTIRAQRHNTYLATAKPEEWPTWFVLTKEIWNQTPETAKQRLTVVQTFRGWAYAAKGRIVDVMVVMKR
ncbi:MAG TPA: glycosyltransferase family 39 protein [Tepidisphaeraceae bacterium]|nr:glycosyltransferase family 39 protein [Tepidisphaeraceae bacterium]